MRVLGTRGVGATPTIPTICRPRRGSIDRIDSSKGYVKGNVHFVCCIVNYAKGRWTLDQFREMCSAISSPCSPMQRHLAQT